MPQVRVRFAPSPTGHLHIGGARTAIYNWAFARRMGGTFILRIDDTDPERSTQENTDAILRAMKWLGLDWDEGPEVGGDNGPYYQTQRGQSYQDALQKMIESGRAYPCFCTAEELAEKRRVANETQGGYSGYDRTCRDIPKEEAQARIQAGEPHVWRLKVPLDHGPVEFDDAVYGHESFPIDVMDDFVLVRSDGTPTYNFTTVVDDAAMGITHVIRGDDHLSNTPRQILVYEALEAPVPTFAHLSMILGEDGKRLSKRHGATSVEAYRDMGYLADALVNYLALLGWSLDGETTIFSKQVLCDNFSLDRISRNDAVFDPAKLDWMDQAYFKEMDPADFVDAVAPWLDRAGLISLEDVPAHREWLEGIHALVAERIHHLDEVPDMVAYLFSGDKVALEVQSVDKVLQKEGSLPILRAFEEVLAEPGLSWDVESLETALRAIPGKMDLKPRVVFQVARVAITGRTVSPPLFESIQMLGRDACLARLKAAEELALA